MGSRHKDDDIPWPVLAVALVFGAVYWLWVHPIFGIPVAAATGTGIYVAARRAILRRQHRLRTAAEYARLQQRRRDGTFTLEDAQAEYQLHITDPANYHHMNAKEFEQAIAALCRRDGCTNVQVVGGAGDLGADVTAAAPDGRRIVIQCKRYGPANKVGSQDMQRFGGTCYNVHAAHVAAVVTTSTFTRPAAQYATGMRIGLFDNDGLAGWASRTGPAPWM